MSQLGFVLAVSLPLFLVACRTSCTRVCCPRTPPALSPACLPADVHGERAARTAPTPSPSSPAGAADREILEALQTKRVVGLEWGDDITVADAVAYLRTITGLEFFVTPKVEAEKADVRLPLRVDNVRIADVLDLLTGPNGLKWEVRDGLVRIATADELR